MGSCDQSQESLSKYILQSQHNSRKALEIQGVTTLPELFQWQARRRHEAVLFSFRTEPDASLTTLSYSEGYTKSLQIAHSLHNLYHNSNIRAPVVGIWLEKSIELHLAILATTTSGATWLPLDADAPATRVTACLQDSEACILLCDSTHYDAAINATKSLPECCVVKLDTLAKQAPIEAKEPLPSPRADDTAYMIYTSGSTGTPKGIEISHGAALTFSLSEQSVLDTGPSDIVWQGFSPAFDMFIEEVWVSIAGGAHLAIGSRSECQDVPGLGGSQGVWAQRGVTLVNAVPTLINIMTSLDSTCPIPPSVRLLNLGGEACPPDLVSRLWSPSLRILNTYGPSETTVTATFQEILPNQRVTIGKPLPMYHALLLPIKDNPGETWAPVSVPLEVGAEGELAIGGKCLGKGYVKRPTLTREKFIDHPLPSYGGERLYRTGDRVRLDEDLNLVFLGRIDTQVKHRGFRIELGEIEHAITSHLRVQTAAVILSTATNNLEAYIVGQDGEVIEVKELRDKLCNLPAYMQPESFFFMSAKDLPRLPSGKINAKGLQETSIYFATQLRDELIDGDTLASFTDMPDDLSDLSILLRAMDFIFPQAEVKATSDFFDDLGGHSLVAATLVSRVRSESPEGSGLRQLGLKAIYQHRTAEKIAASLDNASEYVETSQGKAKLLNTVMGKHWPVSQKSFVLCSIAQIPALILLFFIEGVSLLAPYIVFYAVLRDRDLGSSVVLTYFTFVVIPPLRALVGVVGKWCVLGRANPGEYPLYGLYYYRWWLAERFVTLVDMVSIADTPLLPAMMRLMGAQVGTHSHVGITYIGAAFDLVSIGDDFCMGKDVVLSTSWVERGRLILAPVEIGSQAHIGSNSVLEGGSSIGEGGEIGALSMLPQGGHVPAGELWTGSPARFHSQSPDIGGMRSSRPSEIRVLAMNSVMAFSSIFLLPIITFAPQFPSMLLFDFINIPSLGIYPQTALICVPAAIIYMILVFVELIVLRWLILGKVVERSFRTTSVYFYRKWLVGRLMDMSLVILRPVYATLYVVPYLRCLGVKIGHKAEVSTARGINFELTEIGDESFVADGVLIGDEQVRRNVVALKKTKLNKRAFLGNQSLVPQGTELASNTLVGVMTCAPKKTLSEGQSCFGSPPVLMPVRQRGTEDHAEHLLYKPGYRQIALRLFIEGMRIVVPRILITFGLGFALLVLESAFRSIGAWPIVLLMPLFYFFFFAFPALIITLIFKWILIGRYQRAKWPLWSVNVWKSEFVTATYEALTEPFLTDMLTGTVFLTWAFRLLGVQVGARATLLSTDITEYDMVSLGDEAVINRHAGPQTHLFEDRVMKVGRVDIEQRGCMKAYSICLPNSRIAEGGQLGSLSLLMKGETVPAKEAWEGAPIAPRCSHIQKSFKS